MTPTTRCANRAWIALLVLALSGSLVARAALAQFDVPYVPTPDAVVDRMLEMADVQPDDYLVDLGSGDGRIVVAAARDWGVQKALGVDINPQRIAEAEANALRAGVEDRTTFEQGDLFEMDFTDASVLTLYLLPDVNARLQPVILDEMQPGTRVVSHAFDMGDWWPDEMDVVQGKRIYLWVVPAKVSGQWQLNTADNQAIRVTLTQDFQQIEGYAIVDGQATTLDDPQLRGKDISFYIGTERYDGTVEGNSIVARPSDEGVQGWHAKKL